MNTCRAPDGETACRFAHICWEGIQRLAQQLGKRGMDCPHYRLGVKLEKRTVEDFKERAAGSQDAA